MLKIRLKRIGKKQEPHYRIVVMPARTKRDGKAVEYIGYHSPIRKETKLEIERAKYWLSVGAKPTATVHSILAKHKLLEPLPRPDRPPLKPKKEQEKKEAPKAEKKKEKPKNQEQMKEKSKKETKEVEKEGHKPEKKNEKSEKKTEKKATKKGGKEEDTKKKEKK